MQNRFRNARLPLAPTLPSENQRASARPPGSSEMRNATPAPLGSPARWTVGADSAPEPQDSRAPVTWFTKRPRLLPYAAVMDPSEHDFVSPVCDRPMRLATVLNHAPDEQTFVLQCRPCGLSTTKTVDAPRQSDQRPPSFAGSAS
jgi:hypothetical protein